MVDQIVVGTPSVPPEQPTVDIGTAYTPLPVNPAIADIKANKAALVTGQSRDQIYSQILAGQEDQLRQSTAATIDRQRQVQADQFVTDVAKNVQGGLDQGQLKHVQDTYRALTDPTNPTSVFEEYYPKAFLDQLSDTATKVEDNVITTADAQIPAEKKQVEGIIDTSSAKNEYFKKMLSDARARAEQQATGSYVADKLKEFVVPLYTDYFMRGNVDSAGWFENGLLRGTSEENQRKALVDRPFKEVVKESDRLQAKMLEANPSMAVDFWTKMLGMSTSERYLDNALNGVDVASVPGIGAAAMLSKRALLGATKGVYKGIAKATAMEPMDKAAIIAATGDLEEAAVQKTTQKFLDSTQGKLNPIQDAIDQLPSYMRLDGHKVWENPGNWGRSLATNLQEHAERLADVLIAKISDGVKVDRINPSEFTADMIRSQKNIIKDELSGLNNQILEITDPVWNPVSNTYYHEIHIGDRGGGVFWDYETAHMAATMMKLNGFSVVPEGIGHKIVIPRNMSEINDVVRDGISKTGFSQTPVNQLSAVINKLRTPEDTQSMWDNWSRKVATYTPASYLKAYEDQLQFIRDLAEGKISYDPITKLKLDKPTYLSRSDKSSRWDDFKRMVTATKDIRDPATGLMGYHFQNPAEIEYFYQNMFKRLPDADEIEGYFAFKRMLETDRMWRNVLVYRNKARVGAEQYRIRLPDGSPQGYSDYFDGVLKKTFPGGDDPMAIMINGTKNDVRQTDAMDQRLRNQLVKGWNDGKYKIIEIFNPEETPLAKHGIEQRVRYVITDDHEWKPLGWDQVPRRGGYHLEYEYDHYVSQAKVRRDFIAGRQVASYEGDMNVAGVLNRAEGEGFARNLDNIAQLLARKMNKEAKELAQKTMPTNWKDILGWFNPTKAADGTIVPPLLSKTERIMLRPKDKYLNDIDDSVRRPFDYRDKKTGEIRSTFKDNSRSGSMARTNQVAFTGERGDLQLLTPKKIGGTTNPIFRLDPADIVDPINTTYKALQKVTHSLFTDDYKIGAIEHWLAEAAPHLRAETVKDIRTSPFDYFVNAEKYMNSAVPYEVRQRLMESRRKIQQFMGVQSPVDAFLTATASRLADAMYGAESKTLQKAAAVPNFMLPYIKNAASYFRAIGFHMNLGMGNVSQFFTQLNTYSLIWALSPKNGAKGTAGAYLSMLSRINSNPNVMARYERIAQKMGWKAGEFAEAHALGDELGFFHVGGEYALLDSLGNPKVIPSLGRQILDAGTFFFKEGETMVRYGAFHTAYKEFRDKLPNVRLTNQMKQEILQRADLLNANMSRASNSIMQHGLASIPTQFFTYQMRMSELFLSKRIGETMGERMMARGRMVALYSMLYGIPTGLTVGMAGFPFADLFRQKAIEHDYIPGDKWLSSFAMEGGVAWAAQTVLGYYPNVGQKWGVQGLDPIREALRSDHKFLQIIGGASGSKVMDIISSADGYYAAFLGMMNEDARFTPTSADLMIMMRNVNSVNKAWQSYMAFNTANWYSRKEGLLEQDVTKPDSIFRFITGLQNVAISDLQDKRTSIEERKDLQKETLNQYIREMRRAYDAQRDGNTTASQQHFRNAKALQILGDYPNEKLNQAWALSAKSYETQIDNTNWSFYTKDVGPSKSNMMRDAYIRSQQQLKKK